MMLSQPLSSTNGVTESVTPPGLPFNDAEPFDTSARVSSFSAESGLALLDLRPQSRVLDMHASGRGRARRIMSEIGSRGTLVANIAGASTLEGPGVFGGNGASMTMMHLADEQLRSNTLGLFDRLLLDTRAVSGHCVSSRYAFERQFHLLRRAVDLCAPGGRILYMTGGHTPEENEVVVDRVLNDSLKSLALRPARLASVMGTPGETCWRGQQLDPRLTLTLRLHCAALAGVQSGFVAVIERTG